MDIEETPIELLDPYYEEINYSSDEEEVEIKENNNKKTKKYVKNIDWQLFRILILVLFILVLIFYIIKMKKRTV